MGHGVGRECEAFGSVPRTDLSRQTKTLDSHTTYRKPPLIA